MKDMGVRIHCITFAVDDLERARTFYRDGIGLPVDDKPTEDHLAIKLPDGLYLVLILREGFSEFTKLTNQMEAARGVSECILSYFGESEEEVDAIMERAEKAGGMVACPPTIQQWGYAGYIKDPDGHIWEIMFNPEMNAHG